MSYLLVIIYPMEEEKVPTVDNNFVHSSQEDLPTHEQSSCTNLELSKVETGETGTSPTALPVWEKLIITKQYSYNDAKMELQKRLKENLRECELKNNETQEIVRYLWLEKILEVYDY